MDLQTSGDLQQTTRLREKAPTAAYANQAALVFILLAEAALGAGIAFIPFRPAYTLAARPIAPLYPGYTNLVLYPADPFFLAAILFWAASLLLQPRRIAWKPLWLILPLAGLTAAAAASIPFSADPTFSIYQSLRIAGLFALVLFILNEVKSLRVVMWGAAAQVAIQSAVGVAQVLRQHSLGLTALHELALDPSQSGISIVWSTGLRSLRAYGLTDHPNILGGCLALALILLAAGYLKAREPWKMILVGLAALGSLALLASFSRSAWLGFAGGIVLLAGWLALQRRWSDLGRGGALAAACLLVLLPFFWQNAALLGIRLGAGGSFTAATPENQSINERGLLAGQALALFAAHPVSGVGAGTFPQALHHADPTYPFNLQPPHLVALDVAAETGAPGAVFYLLLEALPWVMLIAARRRLRFSVELAAVSAGLFAVSIISLLDYYPWAPGPGQYWQWLLWGLWGALFVQSIREPRHA